MRIALAVLLGFATAAFAQHHDSRVRDLTREEVAALPSFEFEGRDVFVMGDEGPPILLLHELPGLTPQAIWLAQALADEGFTVYAPLLFGAAGHHATRMNAFLITVNGHWHPLRKSRTAPIIDYLRRLADHVHEVRNSGSMAVIGMCLTGHLPVALLDRDYVVAAVLSQPSLPRSRNAADLALDHKDVRRARERALKLLGFRFTNDSISPREKMDAFVRALPTLDFEELPSPDEASHAVLTTELFDTDGTMRTDHPSRRAYDKIVGYLRGAVGGGGLN